MFSPEKIEMLNKMEEVYPRLVKRIIKAGKFDGWIDFDDLISAARATVILRYDEYAPAEESDRPGFSTTPLESFLITMARFGVVQELYKLRHYSYSITVQRNLIDRTTVALAEKLQRAPTPEEICKAAHISMGKYKSTMEKTSAITKIYLDALIFADGDEPIHDKIKDLSALPPATYIIAREDVRQLRKAIRSLSSMQRYMIEEIYYKQTPRTTVRRDMRLCAKTFVRTHREAIETLAKSLRREGGMSVDNKAIATIIELASHYTKPFMHGKPRWQTYVSQVA